ncbi:hypothetical protein [Naasia aerilata]|uniref:Integral membrane protein n=1 Tax=Naasia aerilata TaxID=1162966 RepID=A0ABM8GAR4_9MICO|nr:hypothetical protein [Naasia aerilata]BDZ45298.1 hypothetical protein GCM10025866_12070 [Naasia aerilata]
MTSPSGALPALGPSRAKRPLRTWDLVLSIVLLALDIALALLLMLFSAFSVMASDPCGSSVECNYDQMGVGLGIAFIAPIVITVLGIATTIVLLVLRRLAFWVPLVTMVLAVAGFAIGIALLIGGVPGATF